MSSQNLTTLTSLQLNLSNSGNGSQRFATKAHRMQGEEVISLSNLRCGMTFKRQTSVGIRHAFAVVDDLNRRTPCIHHQHMNHVSIGINSILDKFFDDTCRTLNHLACRNLVGNRIW